LSFGLAEITGYAVDLLDMRAASTVMQYQILQAGGGRGGGGRVFRAQRKNGVRYCTRWIVSRYSASGKVL